MQVRLSVSPLPNMTKEDELLCLFGDSPPHPARVEDDAIICNSPSSIPTTPPGQGETSPSGPWTHTASLSLHTASSMLSLHFLMLTEHHVCEPIQGVGCYCWGRGEKNPNFESTSILD